MKLRWDEIEETGEPRETKKIPTLSKTIVPLATPKLELGTPVGANGRSNRAYPGNALCIVYSAHSTSTDQCFLGKLHAEELSHRF